MPRLQSTYRRHHSTETALVKVLSDIYAGVDEQQVTLLGLLDLSASLDCVAFCYSDCAQGSASREQYLLDHVILARPNTASVLQAVLIRSTSVTLWSTIGVCFRPTAVFAVCV